MTFDEAQPHLAQVDAMTRIELAVLALETALAISRVLGIWGAP